MELKLKNNDIKYVNKILDTEIAQEESAEIIIPDTMPDILRVVSSDAVVTIRSKTTDTGRVSVTGTISAMVLYCPEAATGLRRVSIDIPFSASVSDGKITQQCQAIASVKLCFADASAVNSRKAVIRASIVTNVKCFCDEVITAGEEIENIERVETLVKTQTAQLSVCVKEKNTSLSDEHTIDNTQNASVDILKYCVETIADEYKIVGNKLVIRARACYSVLYRTGGDIKKLEYYKEFSQIIEFEDIDEGDSFEIVLMPSGVYFECPEPSQTQETKIISELHVLAQCVQNKTFTLKYIADAYSTSAKLNCETEKYCLCTQNSSSCINELLIKTIEIPNQIDNVISVTAHCYGSGINQDGMLRTTVYVSAIYKDLDERIMSSDRRFEVEVTPENIQFSDVSVSSKVAEIYSAVGSKGIDLRISVDFNITTSNYANIESVVGGTCDEIDDVNNGINSIVLRRVTQGDSLWQLAKQYKSTIDTITLVNALEQEQLQPGSVLLIPRVR